MEIKKIHFDNLGKNKYWIIIILLSGVLIFIEELPIEFENPKIYKYIRSSGFFLQAIYWSKLFWFKNTVQWNKKGALIRINSFFGKSLIFDRVKGTELNGKVMIITKKDGTKLKIDLNEFQESDSQKLNEIMIKNTIANNV